MLPKSSSSVEDLLLLFRFTNLLQDECLDPAKFLLKAGSKAAGAVFEKNDEAKGKENEESDPKYSAHQSHGGKPT